MSVTIILLSGGIDSTVMLAMAVAEKKRCHALTFDYGQRHAIEIDNARAIADRYKTPHTVAKIDAWPTASSALLAGGAAPVLPTDEEPIPNTYVPARNTLFLSYGLLHAELLGAEEIWFGSNADDYEPYPDCRKPFFDAFNEVARSATRQAVTQRAPTIVTPLLQMRKNEIIAAGLALEAPLELTMSCYVPLDGSFCGECLSCKLVHRRREAI